MIQSETNNKNEDHKNHPGTHRSAEPNSHDNGHRVNVQCDKPVTAAWLTDMMGRREGVKLAAIGDGHYTLDLAGRPQAIYLLTLLTADGQQHTIRLIKRNKQ